MKPLTVSTITWKIQLKKKTTTIWLMIEYIPIWDDSYFWSMAQQILNGMVPWLSPAVPRPTSTRPGRSRGQRAPRRRAVGHCVPAAQSWPVLEIWWMVGEWFVVGEEVCLNDLNGDLIGRSDSEDVWDSVVIFGFLDNLGFWSTEQLGIFQVAWKGGSGKQGIVPLLRWGWSRLDPKKRGHHTKKDLCKLRPLVI